MSEQQLHSTNVVKAGNSVLLEINDGDRFVFARLNPSATVKLGKAKCLLAPLIGSPFGATFELRRGPKGPFLERCSRDAIEDLDDVGDEEEVDCGSKDNRSLIDNNTAQSLSAEDIDSMRREGSSGQEIVNALIANSTSFGSKTAFSQEKYKRKKQKKYAPWILVRRPTTRSVCEAYFSKSPSKIGFLRMDSLSLLLSYANVGANSNVLVLDMVGGLLTAAVAERLGGYGSVCSVYYTPRSPSVDIVGLFNFSSTTCSRIFRVPLSKVLEAHSAAKKDDAVKPDSDNLIQAEQKEPDAGITGSNMEVEVETPIAEGAATDVSEVPVSSNPDSAAKKDDAVKPDSDNLMQADQKEPDAGITGSNMEVEVETPTAEGAATNVSEDPVLSNPDSAAKKDDAVKPDSDNLMQADHKEPDAGITGSNMEVEIETPTAEGAATDVSEDPVSSNPDREKSNPNRVIHQASDEEISGWVKGGFSSLIVGALDVDPLELLQQLLPLLSPSSPFVVYHSYLQPLADCMFSLQKERMAVSLQLTEPWLREYQVLPSRTHPHMQMSSTGGYVLSGVRVVQ